MSTNLFGVRRAFGRILGTATAAVLAAGLLQAAVLLAQSSVITEASIRGHMELLASDAMNGRGSGTRDEWVAATYIGSQMRQWGIEPLGDNGGYVQQVDSGRWQSAAPPILIVQGRVFITGKEMNAQSLSVGSPTGMLHKYKTGTPVPAGSFAVVSEGVTAVPAEIATAAGVITLQAPPGQRGARPGGAGAGGGAAGAAGAAGGAGRAAGAAVTPPPGAAGAAAVPAAGAGRGPGAPPAGGAAGAGGRGGPPTPPQQWRFALTRDAFAGVDAMADGAPVTVVADVKPGHTWNAIGQLKGSDPTMAAEVILLTAHLDHLGSRGTGPDTIFNGADDDASGSTAVLELAEAIAKGPRPKRTVMFAWFGSEESGGAGARNFLEHPPVPLKQIVANLEFEMLGRADDKIPPHSLWLTGYERSDLGAMLFKQGAKIYQDPHPEQNFFSRSDNIQLARKGIIAQTVSSFNLHKDYHQASDEISTIDFAHMTESIQSMFAPVMWLSNSDFKPTWVAGQCPAPCGGH